MGGLTHQLQVSTTPKKMRPNLLTPIPDLCIVYPSTTKTPEDEYENQATQRLLDLDETYLCAPHHAGAGRNQPPSSLRGGGNHETPKNSRRRDVLVDSGKSWCVGGYISGQPLSTVRENTDMKRWNVRIYTCFDQYIDHVVQAPDFRAAEEWAWERDPYALMIEVQEAAA